MSDDGVVQRAAGQSGPQERARRGRVRRWGAAAIALRACRVVLGGVALLAVLAIPASARADAVTDWNAVAAAALQASPTATPPAVPGAGQGAVSTAHLAVVHGAVYDAVNAIVGCYEPYVSSPAAKRWYSQDAAVAAAARHVLVNGGLGIPDARMPLIEAAYQAALEPIEDGPAKAGGIATGQAAATDMLAARAGDGRFGPFRFSESTLPGGWRLVPPATVTDPGAWLKDVTPFVLHDPDRFRGRPPLRLGSRAYARDFNEVKAIGRTDSPRTPDQTAAAQYWGTTNATATMASIIRSVADTQGGTLADHARLLARVYTNAADALIVTWRDKARYSFWRPFHAIREAASDGNPATEADPTWTSMITAPLYPEHPSGLSTFGSAVAHTMKHFYGRDEATFTGTTPGTATTPGGMTRQFTSFSQLPDDIVEARIWSGIHFRFADTEGAKIGRKVAHWGNQHAFR